jgi:transcriptional regulator with XRE-family HTH domain
MPKAPKSTVGPPSSTTLATASGAPEDDAGTLGQRIGREVRSLRTRLGLTGSELARAAKISTGMLSKIETGQISASLGTLDAIASVLNVSLSSLFAGTEPRRDCSFVKAGNGVQIDRRGTKAGHRYELLGHSVAGPLVVEPYLITLAPDAAPYTSFQHAGVEIIYMLTGRVVYRHGDQVYDMNPGDTLFFDATSRHGPEDLPKLPSTYLSIIIYPRPREQDA